MSKKEVKTNAMRILERNKISYEMTSYECDEFVDGVHTADILGIPHDMVYKTILTIGKSKNYYVCVVPIESEIDLKKAAKAFGEKSLEMSPLKDLTTVTGYIRGGCTAIGMKKQFPTIIQIDAQSLSKIAVSGGKIGLQLTLNPLDLQNVTKAQFADIIK